ncbi:Uncharacterised protein [Mycobacteroides abscessus subsp. abscessus]|nr:Uncharacterised protein [Mycobacteroides abscessus subsp. abscessus]
MTPNQNDRRSNEGTHRLGRGAGAAHDELRNDRRGKHRNRSRVRRQLWRAAPGSGAGNPGRQQRHRGYRAAFRAGPAGSDGRLLSGLRAGPGHQHIAMEGTVRVHHEPGTRIYPRGRADRTARSRFRRMELRIQRNLGVDTRLGAVHRGGALSADRGLPTVRHRATRNQGAPGGPVRRPCQFRGHLRGPGPGARSDRLIPPDHRRRAVPRPTRAGTRPCLPLRQR